MSDSADITTDRLLLRLVTSEDASDIFDYGRDPEVARFTSWPAHRSIGDAEAYVALVLTNQSAARGALRHVWAIRLRSHAQVIGTIDLMQRTDDTAFTDFALARSCWNRGYMTEAVREVTAWGFERLRTLRQVRSSCLTENVRSRCVLEKAGFPLVRREQVRLPAKFALEQREMLRYEVQRRAQPTADAV